MRAKFLFHAGVFFLIWPLFLAAKENWILLESPNFRLVGNASEKQIRQVAVNLEQFRAAFSRLFQLQSLRSTVPTRVIIFRSNKAFTPFKPLYQGKPSEVAGYFQGGREVHYIAMTAEYSGENPFELIFHEYVHNLLHHQSSQVPLWFDEGVAEFYSTFQVSGNSREVTLGKPKSNSIFLLREHKLIPLAQLFQVNHGSREYHEKDQRNVFYAESWALLHYLMLGMEGKRQPQLSRFLISLTEGQPEAAAFRSAFQCDYAVLEKELREYVGRVTYPITIFTLQERLEKIEQLPSRPLSGAEVAYYLGDLLQHCNRPEEARPYLQQAIDLDPGLAPAHAALGKLFAQAKNWNQAREHLEKAVTQDSKDFLTPFVFAETLVSLETSHGSVKERFSDETTSLIFSQLKKSVETAPDFVEAYNLYGYVSLVTGKEFDQAVACLKKAVSLAPGRSEIALNLAQLYLRRDDLASAKKILAPLALKPGGENISTQAQLLLDQIRQQEEQLVLIEKARQEAERERQEAQAAWAKSPAAGGPANQTSGQRPVRPAEGSTHWQRDSSPEQTMAPKVPMLWKCSACKKVAGILVASNCTRNGIEFVIKVGSRPWKFLVTDLDNLLLFNSRGENLGSITMTCGPISPSQSVVAEYRPSERETLDDPGKLINLTFADR